MDAEMPIHQEESEKLFFHTIDQNRCGLVNRPLFYAFMAIRRLGRLKPSQIIHLLNSSEIRFIRKSFTEADTDNVGSISQEKARAVYIDWYMTRVQQRPGSYVDYTWYGGPKENALLVQLRRNCSSRGSSREIMISWEQFLKICSLHVLSARLNTFLSRPLIPPMPIHLYSKSACLHYLDEDMNVNLE